MRRSCSSGLIALVTVFGIGIGLQAAAHADTTASPPDSWIALYGGNYAKADSGLLLQPRAGLSISGGGTPSGVTVSTSGPNYYMVSLTPAPGQALAVGAYHSAQRAWFNAAGHPGVDVTGNYQGCNTETGDFTIVDIAFTGGTLSRLDATFVDYCDNAIVPTIGEIRYHDPETGPLTIQAVSVQFPPQYVGVANGQVPLWVTNPGPTPVAVGPTTVSGTGAPDVAIAANTCPALLDPGATCVITTLVTPRGAGVRQAAVTVAAGGSGTAASLTDTGIAGNAAFVLDTPLPFGTAPQQENYNQFNATISGTGAPGYVTVTANTPDGKYTAEFAAAPGHVLTVGTYSDPAAAATSPGLSLWSQAASCSISTVGTFTVRAISFDSQGELTQFAADAEFVWGPRGALTWAASGWPRRSATRPSPWRPPPPS